MESQDAAANFFYKLLPQIQANLNRIITIAVIIAVLAAGISFYSWHSGQTQINAGDAVSDALVSMPATADATTIANTYLDIATQYPNTTAGQRALMQGASALFMAGKYQDAQTYFQQYMNAHPDGPFAGQAGLGVAKCLEAQQKYDQAAGAYQHVIDNSADAEAVIDSKFSLGRLDVRGKNYAEAMRLFQDVMQADPYGVMGNEAGQLTYEIKSKVPTPAPVVPAGTGPMTPTINLKH
jgi:TolA-binding protein